MIIKLKSTFTNDLSECESIGNFYIEGEDHNEKGNKYYSCICMKCGCRVLLTHRSLKNQVFKDCGCSTDRTNYCNKNFKDKEYGWIKILSFAYKKEIILGDGVHIIEPVFRCQCIHCGTLLYCQYRKLINGDDKSCGCMAGAVFGFYPDIPEKPEFQKGVYNPKIDEYYKTLAYNRAKARRMEKNLIVNADKTITGKDGRIYPLRWSKEPVDKIYPIKFHPINKGE